jgi:hypothetical protein
MTHSPITLSIVVSYRFDLGHIGIPGIAYVRCKLHAVMQVQTARDKAGDECSVAGSCGHNGCSVGSVQRVPSVLLCLVSAAILVCLVTLSSTFQQGPQYNQDEKFSAAVRQSYAKHLDGTEDYTSLFVGEWDLVREITLLTALAPTAEPTAEPSAEPSAEPTAEPTEADDNSSAGPSATPTRNPTRPTVTPTAFPTAQPTTSTPTKRPTRTPTAVPTGSPSVKPTARPTPGKSLSLLNSR